MNGIVTADRPTAHRPVAGRPVLAGIGGGGDRLRVARHAALHAGLHHRPLHLLHIAERAGPAGPLADPAEDTLEALASLMRTEFPGLTVCRETTHGRTADALLSRSHGASRLVLGHQGGGGLPRLPLGSVGRHVAAHAPCPVIVIPPREAPEAPENRVVVGVDVCDTSPVSDEALDLAFTEAELRGARLELLHAAFHPGETPVGPGLVPPDYRAPDDAARLLLEAETAKRRNSHPGLRVHVRVERVRPATLLREAGRRAALLVVGSHGRGGLRRLVLGSVSAETLRSAACPVAVVPSAAVPLADGGGGRGRG
ncbi:universal stress protein [Streptomyces natalensis]|uniref:universal stress protein n=1 Tax=Streptomyces natalensis TaxID=68242 RepID=UPI0005C9B804|nr:universal stress protein [Streptomyces natalensis]